MKALRLARSLLLASTTAAAASAQGALYKLVVIEPQDPYPLAVSGLTDVNDLGLVVGNTWINGQLVRLEWTVTAGFRIPSHLPPTGERRVNNFGDSILYNGGTTTIVLAGGTQIPIPPPPNSDPGVNRDLNDALVLVGHSVSTGTTSSLFTWNPLDGTETILIDDAKELRRVNAGTLAVGTITLGGTSKHGILVDVATHTHVDFRTILPGTGGSELFDVNDSGRVVGYGPYGNGIGQVGCFVWDASSGLRFLPGLKGGPTAEMRPSAIDNSGRVVGWARTGDGETRAFLWDPVLGIFDLNDLVGGAGDFRMREATDISETGVIIGHGFHGAVWGPDRGFILAPRTSVGGPLRAPR